MSKQQEVLWDLTMSNGMQYKQVSDYAHQGIIKVIEGD